MKQIHLPSPAAGQHQPCRQTDAGLSAVSGSTATAAKKVSLQEISSMTRRDLYIDGHKLVALNLNPVEMPGHPVFLLHGIGGSVHFWNDDQTRVFQEQGPCYALSLPGHYPAAFPTEFREEQITAIMIAELLVKARGSAQ